MLGEQSDCDHRQRDSVEREISHQAVPALALDQARDVCDFEAKREDENHEDRTGRPVAAGEEVIVQVLPFVVIVRHDCDGDEE